MQGEEEGMAKVVTVIKKKKKEKKKKKKKRSYRRIFFGPCLTSELCRTAELTN